MDKNSTIYVAGHRGLVGSAIVRELKQQGYKNIITKTHQEVDLTNQKEVEVFFSKYQPEYVFLAAAKVGGIIANNRYRANFIYDNLLIQTHVIHQSYLNKVKKLLFLGSTCIYPKNAPQPLKEEYLLTGELEYTNEPYAIAKIAGIKMCESYNLQHNTNYLSVMPTNLYGYNDNFDLETSHVLPALIRKIHLGKLLEENNQELLLKDLGVNSIQDAKKILTKHKIHKNQITLYGTGKPKREFLWSQDMAQACVFIMNHLNFNDIKPKTSEIRNTHINIGSGIEISIKELATLIKKIIGYKGTILFDATQPDGTLRKLTDVSKIHSFGWKHTIDLETGIKKLYSHYLQKRS